MAGIAWSREALSRLREIRIYIRNFDPRAAERTASRLLAAGESLSEFSERGRPAADGCRELPSIRPYIIVYEVVGDEVTILDIRHSAQLPRKR